MPKTPKVIYDTSKPRASYALTAENKYEVIQTITSEKTVYCRKTVTIRKRLNFLQQIEIIQAW